MTKKTDQELQTELQDVVKKHNEALEIVNQCKTRAIQIQAIMEDRKSGVVIPDTAPAVPPAPPAS
jgi:hypothetical protein|tara:strand:- start:223 stop:417 length:195 start_codon:yes stop_codon:yes gene_type:complete